jgi:hypothetical protein
MQLMTVSMVVIIVLHSKEVVHVPMSRDYPWKAEYSLYRQATLHTSEVCARKITTRLFNGFI